MLPLRFLLPILLFDSVYVLSRPLSVEYVVAQPKEALPCIPAPQTPPNLNQDDWTGDRPNREIINDAVSLANQMLRKMMQVIETPDTAGHKKMIEAAFGRHANIGRIKKNIEAIIEATIRICESKYLCEETFGKTTGIQPQADAAGKGERQAKVTGEDYVMDRMTFSTIFFEFSANERRATTVIHEAAHYVNHATDDVVEFPAIGEGAVGMKICAYGEMVPDGATFQEGYAYHEMPKDLLSHPTTVDQVRSDKEWEALTESAHNMDESADAYRVFAHLCEHEHDARPEK